jgi:ribosomal protein L32
MEGSNPAPRRRTRAAGANAAPSEEGAPGLVEDGTPGLVVDGAPAVVADGTSEVVEQAGATSFMQRAPLRRRLRYLSRRREVALRDLGGFVFESHRQGEEQPGLIADKLGALRAIDDEREQLERALDQRREVIALREPGISVCAECSTLHGSEANFCPHCGTATGSDARDRKTAGR